MKRLNNELRESLWLTAYGLLAAVLLAVLYGTSDLSRADQRLGVGLCALAAIALVASAGWNFKKELQDD